MTDPTWAIVLPMVLLGSYATGWLSVRLGLVIASLGRRGEVEGASWVERARWAYPARVVAGKNLIFAPFAIGAIVGAWVAPRSGLPMVPLTVLGGLTSLIAVMIEVVRVERRSCGPVERGGRGIPVSFVLFLPGLVTFGLMLASMPTRWGFTAGLVVAAGLAAMLFQITGGWLIVLRWMGLVRPGSDRLTRLVNQASERMGVRHRGVFELNSPQANAIAWPVPRWIVFTGPIVECLDDAELSTIAAHELGHLNESWGVFLVRILSPLLIVAMAACVPLSNSFGLFAALAPLLGLLVLIVVGRKVGRRMEERSDQLGLEHEGDEAGTYARALALVYETNLMPVVTRTGRKSVHPDLYDRLIASGVTPDYPRPQPPPSAAAATLPLYGLAFAAFLIVMGSVKQKNAPEDLGRNHRLDRRDIADEPIAPVCIIVLASDSADSFARQEDR